VALSYLTLPPRKPTQSEVVAVGNGMLLESGEVMPLVKPGDLVLFGKYVGNAIKVGDKEMLVLREKDIIAVLE
jgi:chaperonin GroES